MAATNVEFAARRFIHPNDLDRKRIERAIAQRLRYRYVSPRVSAVTGGYRIESPCCSRNIDANGGIIDVALIEFRDDTETWHLHRKNHVLGKWEFHSAYDRLSELLDRLNADPERKFWQ
jgi:hypothetical protein